MLVGMNITSSLIRSKQLLFASLITPEIMIDEMGDTWYNTIKLATL